MGSLIQYYGLAIGPKLALGVETGKRTVGSTRTFGRRRYERNQGSDKTGGRAA